MSYVLNRNLQVFIVFYTIFLFLIIVAKKKKHAGWIDFEKEGEIERDKQPTTKRIE